MSPGIILTLPLLPAPPFVQVLPQRQQVPWGEALQPLTPQEALQQVPWGQAVQQEPATALQPQPLASAQVQRPR
jgi:hypothetical protein